MKVLYIHQYFKTPSNGGGLRSYYLAKELVSNGHEVVMITAHNQARKEIDVVDGIRVVYLPILYSNQMTFSQRGRAFIRFLLLATMESIKQQEIDLCYVMTTPLSTGVIALFNKYFLGRPYIFEVGDIWPKVPIEMGLIKSKWKQQVLRAFERVFYKKAKGLVGLSEPITSYLQQIAPHVPTQTIFNISDCERFAFPEKDHDLIEKYKVQNKFVISYTGTFGLANDLCQVIDWATAVRDLPIHFIMVGDGAEKLKVCAAIADSGATNVSVFDAMPKDKLREVLNVSDAMMVSFANYPTLHTGSPNKFFDALAAGKLVVTNFRGWLGELIESEDCGIVAVSPEVFREKIKRFVNDDVKLKSYQANARKLAEERFDLKIQSRRQLEFIEQLSS